MNGAESDAEKVRFRLAKRGSCQSGTCHPFRVWLKNASGRGWGGFVLFWVCWEERKKVVNGNATTFRNLWKRKRKKDMIWGIVGGFWFWIRICVMHITRHHLSQRFTFHFKLTSFNFTLTMSNESNQLLHWFLTLP